MIDLNKIEKRDSENQDIEIDLNKVKDEEEQGNLIKYD